MTKHKLIENRTAADWAIRIAELETKVEDADRRVADIDVQCTPLSLLACEGNKQASDDLSRRSADLKAAIADRDGLRENLIAARKYEQEVQVREANAAHDEVRNRISELGDLRAKQAIAAQKAIARLTVILNKMHDTGVEIDRLTRQREIRNHYVGEGFSSRLCQAISPALKPFGILAHSDSSHPKYGQALTVGEGNGSDALTMLDRGIKLEADTQARRDATQARVYGSAAA